MKKLISILLMLCLCFSVGIAVTACDKESSNPSASYTVTESEWKMNFNLTKGQTQAQTLAFNGQVKPQILSNNPTEITSYTVFAEGENDGISGTSLLKVAPNAMSIEFYIGQTLREDESGTFASTTDFYQGLTKSVMSYFPFENYYNDFTYDQTKKAYVCQNLTSITYDEYDVNITNEVHTKTAEVTFINGYLNTITVELCDKNFVDVFASFVFTFSNINKTVVEL